MIAAKPVPIDLSLSSILRLTWTTMPDSTYFRITRARVAQFTNRRNTNNFLDNILYDIRLIVTMRVTLSLLAYLHFN